MNNSIYADGSYGASNPDWHRADSQWKARQIAGILKKNHVRFASCAEVGCGAGQVIAGLAKEIPGPAYEGYDFAEFAAGFWNREPGFPVTYHLADFLKTDATRDLILVIDVIEHVDDYLGFLRALASRGQQFVFHIPLEMHASAVLRANHGAARQSVGHIHYFSRETALLTLKDCGYAITDWQYTKLSQETTEGRTGRTQLANVARKGLELASVELAARLLGGYSLLVLAKPGFSGKAAAA